MDYKKETNERLKKLFKNKPMTEDELRVLAEILTYTREEGYEAGYKDGVAESLNEKDEDEGSYYEKVKSGQYRYVTNHGIGPGAYPEDLAGYRCLENGKTELFFDRVLTEEELEEYDIKAEWES